MRFCIVEQPVSAVADGDGASRRRIRGRPNAHGGGHGEEHRVSTAFQLRTHFCRYAGAKELAVVHHGDARCKAKGFFQAVFGQEDGRTKLAVDFAEGGKKIRCGDGVKLACRLVEDQDFWLEHHDGRQIQKLLLPAGQLRDGLIEPRLNAEKRCHLRDAAANRRRIVAEGFQPERQFVPDLIRDDLILRALLHKANLLGLFALGQHVEVSAVKKDFTVSASMRREDSFQLPQKRTFAAARGAAKHQKLARLDGQRQIGNCVFRLFRVSKIQAFDCKDFHCLSSIRSRITGVRTSAR